MRFLSAFILICSIARAQDSTDSALRDRVLKLEWDWRMLHDQMVREAEKPAPKLSDTAMRQAGKAIKSSVLWSSVALVASALLTAYSDPDEEEIRFALSITGAASLIASLVHMHRAGVYLQQSNP